MRPIEEEAQLRRLFSSVRWTWNPRLWRVYLTIPDYERTCMALVYKWAFQFGPLQVVRFRDWNAGGDS